MPLLRTRSRPALRPARQLAAELGAARRRVHRRPTRPGRRRATRKPARTPPAVVGRAGLQHLRIVRPQLYQPIRPRAGRHQCTNRLAELPDEPGVRAGALPRRAAGGAHRTAQTDRRVDERRRSTAAVAGDRTGSGILPRHGGNLRLHRFGGAPGVLQPVGLPRLVGDAGRPGARRHPRALLRVAQHRPGHRGVDRGAAGRPVGRPARVAPRVRGQLLPGGPDRFRRHGHLRPHPGAFTGAR